MTDSSSPNSDFPPKLGQPALRALHGAGYDTLAQLRAIRESDLARLHGVGPNALAKLREAMAAQGLAFADSS